MVTLGKHNFFGWILILGVLSRCGVSDIQRDFLSEHANRLLSEDASKNWQLVSRTQGEESIESQCIESNVLTFVKATAGDSLYILGRPVNCQSNDNIDTLYKAKYELDVDTDDVFQNTITLTEERHATIGSMTVEELTSSVLIISYSLDGQTLIEEYTP